jgi:antitoxin YefM
MSITASEARRKLFPLIEQVNDDRTVVEIVSRRGNAVLMSADDYAALEETAYLLRSPENVRRLLTAYTDALEGRNLVERDLSELAAMADDS